MNVVSPSEMGYKSIRRKASYERKVAQMVDILCLNSLFKNQVEISTK